MSKLLTHIIVGIDDEPMFMTGSQWSRLRDGAFGIIEQYHLYAASTEECILFDAALKQRVLQIRAMALKEDVKRIADQLKELLDSVLSSDEPPEGRQQTISMLTLLATDFNRSLIITRDAVKPWDKFIRSGE